MSTSKEFTPDGGIRTQPGSTIGSTSPSGTSIGSTAAGPDSGARPITSQAKEEVKRVADQVEQGVRERGEQLRDKVEAKADAGRSRAAETGDALAAAFRAAGDSLRERREDRLSHLTDELAEQVEHFAGYLRENDMRGLVGNLEDVARRNPTGFLGSTLAAGLMAGRFLRSSGSDVDGESRGMGVSEPTGYRPPSHREFGAAPATGGPSSSNLPSTDSPMRDLTTRPSSTGDLSTRDSSSRESSDDSSLNRGGFR